MPFKYIGTSALLFLSLGTYLNVQQHHNLGTYFMVTPCINNIQHFNFQLMHTTLKT